MKMFAITLKQVDKFLESIACNQCLLPNDNLQFVGTGCKHVFCWTCVNELCSIRFPQCPLCGMPIGTGDISSAKIFIDLFQLGLQLKENIKNVDIDKLQNGMLDGLFELDAQKRTFEEFCATQKDAEVRKISNENIAEDSSKAGPSNVEKINKRTPKKSIEIEDGLNLQPVPQDVGVFTQMPTQYESLPQMTQQFPVFQEPNELYFFKNRPSKTFADRGDQQSAISSPRSRKRSLRTALSSESSSRSKRM